MYAPPRVVGSGIVAVNGIRVVVEATDYPGTTAQRQAELWAIVDPIQIEP
jgi:hypothetical protein